MNSKEHFEKQKARNTLSAPDDIRFVLYGKNTWNMFVDLLKKKQGEEAVGQDKMSILDLGCGGGSLLHCLAGFGYTNLSGADFVIGIKDGFLPPSFKFIEADVCSVPVKDNQYDCVCSTMTIEHCDDRKFLAETLRLLKPGGLMLITTVYKTKGAWYWHKNANGESVIEPSHLREYTDENALENILGSRAKTVYKEIAPIKYPIIDPLLKIMARYIGKDPLNKFLIKKLRLLRVTIPGYYSLEYIGVKMP